VSKPSRFLFDITPNLLDQPVSDQLESDTGFVSARRHLEIDEDIADDLLSGKLDIDEFINF